VKNWIVLLNCKQLKQKIDGIGGIKMKDMPQLIKRKLRKLQKLNREAQQLDNEINELFKDYGVDTDNLCAVGEGELQTEAFAFISNSEGDVEDNISEIEKVFLYYVNKQLK